MTARKPAYTDRQIRDHDRRMVQTYNLEPGEYATMLLLQNGVCAVCGKRSTIRLSVDHDHKVPGRRGVRGLLCSRCNQRFMGSVEFDIEVMRRAVEYLLRAISIREDNQ